MQHCANNVYKQIKYIFMFLINSRISSDIVTFCNFNFIFCEFLHMASVRLKPVTSNVTLQ